MTLANSTLNVVRNLPPLIVVAGATGVAQLTVRARTVSRPGEAS